MLCINCFHGKTDVYNSRPSKKQAKVWRRRRCPDCGYSFTTIEQADMSSSYLVAGQNSSKPLPFSHATLILSLLEVLTYAGSIPEDAFWLAQTIEQELVQQYRPQKPLQTRDLAKITLTCLRNYNQLAAMAYATRHKLSLPKPGRPRKHY